MTAVEWLEKEIENISIQVFDGFLTFIEFMEEREKLCKQAKEMEEQQIIDAFQEGKDTGWYQSDLDADEYYNETFKK